MKLLVVLPFVLLQTLVCAFITESFGVEDSISPDVPHIPSPLDELQNEKRDDGDKAPFDKCVPPSKDTKEKRMSEPLEHTNGNGTLARRMRLPDGENQAAMNQFMKTEMDEKMFKLIVWQRRVGKEYEDMATAVFRKFEEKKAVSLGTDGLCGCTVLTVVSRKGVYMAHYYEGVSFAPEKEWIEYYGDEDKCFEETVIEGLTNGIKYGNKVEQPSLKGKANFFDDDHVRAYIMHPNKAWNDKADTFESKYEKRWQKMKDTVGDLVPKLKDESRWGDITYNRLQCTSPHLQTRARGKILFKFDPKHKLAGDDGKEMTQKKAALWAEDTTKLRHDDTWDDVAVEPEGDSK